MEAILPLIPAGATPINKLVSVWNEEPVWTYFLGINPIYRHRADDRRMFRLTAAQLIDTGNCRPVEIIETFGVSKSCIDRAILIYRTEGAAGFFKDSKGGRSGSVLTPGVLDQAQACLDAGKDRSAVAGELGIKYDTLSKAIQEGRLRERVVVPSSGSTKSERSVEDAQAGKRMGTACTRVAERLMAAVGRLSGATTCFEECRDVPHGGLLCALPALLSNGLLCGLDKLGQLKGYYLNTHVLMLLAFMFLARIKTTESLRGQPAGELGKLLGLDRIPEVRCLRRKMDELSEGQSADRWAAELANGWMQADPDRVGTLYVDGHVQVYYGYKTKLPRKYVSRQRLCLRGINHYWVNDWTGRPFFVVDKEVDPGMLQVLGDEIVPRLLRDLPNQPGKQELKDNPLLARLVLVFDREGYSPAFFKRMWLEYRVACITYHKHPAGEWPRTEFIEHTVTMSGGESVNMQLAERGSLVGTGADALWMREVRKLTESGHQTSMISTAYGLDHIGLASRIFSRWCQENFFRYMMQHFAIDLLNEYTLDDLPDTEKVVNPLWRQLEGQRQSVQSKLNYRHARFGQMTLQPEQEGDSKKMENWQHRKAKLLEEIEHYEHELELLRNKRNATSKHISWEQLDQQDRFKTPLGGRKRLTDTIKMIAYRAETAMAEQLKDRFTDTSAARRLLQDLFKTEADLKPDYENKQLHVLIHRASRPAADKALARLLEQLNDAQFTFPGTDMTICYRLLAKPLG